MIELDGSLGEGGGQILRTALALSLISQQPFRINNIRAKRPKPGLMRQHLACVQAAVAICGGALQTAAVAKDGQAVQVGDTSLHFTPGAVCSGSYEFAIGSAGSCMLVLQTVLWPLALAQGESVLTLRGGTHNPMAPSLSFLELLAQYVRWQSGNLTSKIWSMELRRHGFYPAGGGEVRVHIHPSVDGFAPIELMERGALVEAWAECLHAGVPKGVADRELAVLQKAFNWGDAQLCNHALRANEGPGNALLVGLQYEHITELFASYGERNRSAEQVAHELVKEVRTYMAQTAPVRPHMADQLMIPMALAAMQGKKGQYFATELTEHTRTNAQVIEKFLPVKFVMQAQGDGFLITIADL